MKKILMRSAMSPIREYSIIDVLSNNLIGTNIGNMLFASTVAKTVMREDVTVDTTLTTSPFSKKEIKRINEEYEYFLIPLANAFRKSFMKELKIITDLVRNLNIPCVVVGVGLQADLNSNVRSEFEFDSVVKEFVDAVLDKSSCIGIRGSITGEYLKKLGYIEEKHFTVIGCPSMYLYGKTLPVCSKPEINYNSKISINARIDLPEQIHKFIGQSFQKFTNFYYIPQSIEEERLLYAGLPYSIPKSTVVPSYYPTKITDPLYVNDRVKGFINLDSWFRFLSEMDFSFGTRIHGNVAGILSGIPSYVIASDTRIAELAEYHNIPYMMGTDLKDDSDILEIYEKTDFDSIHVGHKKRFMHYLDFLDKNGIQHIYDDEGEAFSIPFNKVKEELNLAPAFSSFSSVSLNEQEDRLQLYYNFLNKEIKQLKKVNEQSKDKLKTAKDDFKLEQETFKKELVKAKDINSISTKKALKAIRNNLLKKLKFKN